jgi:hypothetical protein
MARRTAAVTAASSSSVRSIVGTGLFEMVVIAVHKAAPSAAIAFSRQPEDTAEAAARQLKGD